MMQHTLGQKAPRGAWVRSMALVPLAFCGCLLQACTPSFAPPPPPQEVRLTAAELPAADKDLNSAPTFDRADLLDSRTCGGCHSQAFEEWQQSPHAAAADDSVFLAMNRMAQRETHGALGNFCVQCHAPMAVHERATHDGLNLASVPRSLKGVTCYFCHDVDKVTGTHNNPLHLADGTVMRGPIQNARANPAHDNAYSALHDRDTLASSGLCGSCHDIVTPPGAVLESTFMQWQQSVYAHAVTGQSCGGCHMPRNRDKNPISDANDAPPRLSHSHALPGLDLPMAHVPQDGSPSVMQNAALAQSNVQALLNKTLQSALCVKQVGREASLRVVLDNVGAGHAFTSGAVQDRRLWVEIRAYEKGKLKYQSGVVPEHQAALNHIDDDMWLVRSCMYNAQGDLTTHFWQAKTVVDNALPTLGTFNVNDPNFYKSNVVRAYPLASGKSLGFVPDKVVMRILLEPIGLDLLDELVATHDLDPQVRAQAKRLVVGPQAELVWTAQDATLSYQEHGMPVQCVSNSRINLTGQLFAAPHILHCPTRSPL